MHHEAQAVYLLLVLGMKPEPPAHLEGPPPLGHILSLGHCLFQTMIELGTP